jgi:hypothetical protein
MKMFCKKCGTEFDGKFCPNCGEPSEPVIKNDQSTTILNGVDMDNAPIKQEKESIFSKTWFIILMTFCCFFPVGLFLMWKYKKFNKPIRIIITAFFAIGLIAAIGGNANSSSKASSNNTKVETVESKVDESEEINTSESEAATVDNREKASEADKQVYDIMLSAESDYNKLAQIMSADGVSMVDLYDASKTAENNFRIYWNNIDTVKCDGIKEYKNAAKNYILNMQSIASSTKKYVDKQNMKDLSNAKASMENSQNYAIQVVSARLQFLTASGFSDEEALNMIAPESESESK